MSFELALVISTLGIAFGMLYASKLVGDESRWHLPLKIFFFSVGIYFLFITSSNALNVLQVNNSTVADMTSYDNLMRTSGLSVTVLSYVNWVMVFWIFGFLVVMSIMALINMGKGKKDIFTDGQGGGD